MSELDAYLKELREEKAQQKGTSSSDDLDVYLNQLRSEKLQGRPEPVGAERPDTSEADVGDKALGFAQGVAEGLTLGWDDTLAAAMGATLAAVGVLDSPPTDERGKPIETWQDEFDYRARLAERIKERDRARAPGYSLAGNVASALLPAGGAIASGVKASRAAKNAKLAEDAATFTKEVPRLLQGFGATAKAIKPAEKISTIRKVAEKAVHFTPAKVMEKAVMRGGPLSRAVKGSTAAVGTSAVAAGGSVSAEADMETLTGVMVTGGFMGAKYGVPLALTPVTPALSRTFFNETPAGRKLRGFMMSLVPDSAMAKVAALRGGDTPLSFLDDILPPDKIDDLESLARKPEIRNAAKKQLEAAKQKIADEATPEEVRRFFPDEKITEKNFDTWEKEYIRRKSAALTDTPSMEDYRKWERKSATDPAAVAKREKDYEFYDPKKQATLAEAVQTGGSVKERVAQRTEELLDEFSHLPPASQRERAAKLAKEQIDAEDFAPVRERQVARKHLEEGNEAAAAQLSKDQAEDVQHTFAEAVRRTDRAKKEAAEAQEATAKARKAVAEDRARESKNRAKLLKDNAWMQRRRQVEDSTEWISAYNEKGLTRGSPEYDEALDAATDAFGQKTQKDTVNSYLNKLDEE